MASALTSEFPQNQHLKILLDTSIPNSFKNQYMAGSLFTGGHNYKTRAFLKDIVMGSEVRCESINIPGGSLCWVPGCDAKVMRDDKGVEFVACQCDFKLCRECFHDVIITGDRICPGCKEPYELNGKAPFRELEPERKTSSTDNSIDVLFKTNGTYGYGNAIWTKKVGDDDEDGFDFNLMKTVQSRPITRKLNVSATVLSSYRFLLFIRMCALALYLAWRILNPNKNAIWLWCTSVVCEIWLTLCSLLHQLTMLFPVNRTTSLDVLSEKFEPPNFDNIKGKSELPGIDVFISTTDSNKEPVLTTASTILSVLAADYPVENLSCYVSDDGGSLLVFETVAETSNFARLWVPFCRKHHIEPRNPEAYFSQKDDLCKNKVHSDFVRDHRRLKREYAEFRVRIISLCDSIQQRSSAYNESFETLDIPKATWMADGTPWPGTWTVPAPSHSIDDHTSVIKVMLKPPCNEPVIGIDSYSIDLTGVDRDLPMLVYISRERQPGWAHNGKAGAINVLLRASALISNAPFIINLDSDQYVYKSQAFREGISFMMDHGGSNISFVQFPQRFEESKASDGYASHITSSLDVNMRALDGIQGPIYTGSGCLIRRVALYGFVPPQWKKRTCCCSWLFGHFKKPKTSTPSAKDAPEEEDKLVLILKKFGNSTTLCNSIQSAEFQGHPLEYDASVKNGRSSAALITSRHQLDGSTLAEAISVASCSYEDKTDWGKRIGWTYGYISPHIISSYRMHNRGWKSFYHMTKTDAFRKNAPINLTSQLHQALHSATGSIEILFSRHNAILAGHRMKLLQRIAYLNIQIHPFTSIFLIVYCLLPAVCFLSGQFIVPSFTITSLIYLSIITSTSCLHTMLEIKWSGINIEQWWKKQQFWLITATSSHFIALPIALFKLISGIHTSFCWENTASSDTTC